MGRLRVFDDAILEKICRVLGEVTTGGEITSLFSKRNIPDPEGDRATKWRRLYAGLSESQARHSAGNHVVQVIYALMDPVRYTGRLADFEDRRGQLNTVLAFAGYFLHEDGKLREVSAATSLADAEARAGRLRAELSRRRVHPDVLKACRAELVQDNYFHAVLEATKSVAVKIRQLANLTADGHRLVDEAFGISGGTPRLAFNTLRTDSERNEHLGFMSMLKGTFSAFRNPTAHEPKEQWSVSEEDALDLLSVVSLLHRRLDAAVAVPSTTS